MEIETLETNLKEAKRIGEFNWWIGELVNWSICEMKYCKVELVNQKKLWIWDNPEEGQDSWQVEQSKWCIDKLVNCCQNWRKPGGRKCEGSILNIAFLNMVSIKKVLEVGSNQKFLMVFPFLCTIGKFFKSIASVKF